MTSHHADISCVTAIAQSLALATEASKTSQRYKCSIDQIHAYDCVHVVTIYFICAAELDALAVGTK